MDEIDTQVTERLTEVTDRAQFVWDKCHGAERVPQFPLDWGDLVGRGQAFYGTAGIGTHWRDQDRTRAAVGKAQPGELAPSPNDWPKTPPMDEIEPTGVASYRLSRAATAG